MLKLIKQLANHKELINLKNLNKVICYLQNGELLSALKRIQRKIEIFDKSTVREHYYLNDCLYQSEYVELLDTVDIIIPIYNAYEYTEKCLKTIYQNTNSAYNLYLINDCSTDKKIDELLLRVESQKKTQWLKQLYIVNNIENMGFIGTVNKGMSMSNNDIVILNTDTEVPVGWLQRIMQPILKNEYVASVTPFSNSATICSFPKFCEDNVLPKGIDVNTIDALFENYGSGAIVDIPTGVGFCMAMSRKCIKEIGVLDEVYGKGYGEENDWCRRAVRAGYTNTMITNLFVYHKHGASFGEIVTKSKQDRIHENLQILTKRYPDYQNVIDEYISRDPVQDIRLFMEVLLERNICKSVKAELIINHSLGGGATTYVKRKIEDNTETTFFVMELMPDGKNLKITTHNMLPSHELFFDFQKIDKTFLSRLCSAFKIEYIFINQLVDYPLGKMVSMILEAKIPYTFFVHDFYCVCPRYNLLNSEFQYCKNEKSVDVCNKCLHSYLLCKDIEYWRKQFFRLLAQAERVITPSRNTTSIIENYYPSINIETIEHNIPQYIYATYNEIFERNEVFHISVLGAIGIEKGARILDDLVKLIQENGDNIKITVIGYTDIYPKAYVNKSGMLEISGAYDNRDVSDLLARYKTNIVLIPSIWPETYSYTVSEAIYSGYKVLAFNMGAPADRIRETGMGWLVNEVSSEALYKMIVSIRKKS